MAADVGLGPRPTIKATAVQPTPFASPLMSVRQPPFFRGSTSRVQPGLMDLPGDRVVDR